MTSPRGSYSPLQCKCEEGYRDTGGVCIVMDCPPLTPPEDGYFSPSKCNNVFNAACGVRCNERYEVDQLVLWYILNITPLALGLQGENVSPVRRVEWTTRLLFPENLQTDLISTQWLGPLQRSKLRPGHGLRIRLQLRLQAHWVS